MTRRKITRTIMVDNVAIGGSTPVAIQSMTNTDTRDTAATLSQIDSLAAVGCQIVRVAVPDMKAARAIFDIKLASPLPVVADIHFDHRLAIESAHAGADKLRINPGNIGDREKVAQIVHACKEKKIPIRVGVNGGSLEHDLLAKYGAATPMALVESALRNIDILHGFDFDEICVSIKSSSVPSTIEAYRLFSERSDLPLHLGVTETGTNGIIKSAIGIGSLLCDGIGDTIRVSLTAPPEDEIKAALAILSSCGLRQDGVDIISCPTCGRCEVDLFSLAAQVEARAASVNRQITIAVMGCPVNGPGEARAADFGIACGRGSGVLFQHGEIIRRVPECELVDSLFALINNS